MSKIGEYNGYQVYSPCNTFLKSTENGLRYHKSMDYNDLYPSPSCFATWNWPVIGRVSADKSWLTNPVPYDPKLHVDASLFDAVVATISRGAVTVTGRDGPTAPSSQRSSSIEEPADARRRAVLGSPIDSMLRFESEKPRLSQR